MFIGIGLTAVTLLLINRCICGLATTTLVVLSRCKSGLPIIDLGIPPGMLEGRCKSRLLHITSPPFDHFNVLIRAIMRSSVCHRLLRSRFLLDEFRVICKAGLASLSSSNFTIVVY
jgi:hypothetical protein